MIIIIIILYYIDIELQEPANGYNYFSSMLWFTLPPDIKNNVRLESRKCRNVLESSKAQEKTTQLDHPKRGHDGSSIPLDSLIFIGDKMCER